MPTPRDEVDAISAPISLRPERASILPPAPPPPEPIPLDISSDVLDDSFSRPPEKSVYEYGADLANAARDAIRLSQAVPALEPPPPPRPSAPPPPAPPREAAPPPVPVSTPPARPWSPPAVPEATLSRVPIRADELEPEKPSRSRSGAIGETAAPDNVAGFPPRAAACLVDSVILLALNLIFLSPVFLILFFRPDRSREPGTDWTMLLISTLCGLVIVAANFWYLIGGWAKSGRTPGKSLLGLTIVGPERVGRGLGWRTAIMRGIGYLVGGLCFGAGFLAVLFRDDRRGWHDVIADTWVVSRR
jgi:uncharacterized RDD family membrane protein YckC